MQCASQGRRTRARQASLWTSYNNAPLEQQLLPKINAAPQMGTPKRTAGEDLMQTRNALRKNQLTAATDLNQPAKKACVAASADLSRH
ncbi:unnamed protein product [Gongylonema pulchrum]|uniref:Uncharacterized protein n=1 Tax=Gongylonema pulchrum TaxID=637853 RepID=A0A183DRL1_9BILA|nr:unnamed protein product [Gongylonema pulchrum]